ncbi:hypothetical protein GGR58DRAFT_519079 [Xylaria digitata]|nr:hypothetical protein GGR58DRAFT_519079 [Xylaria digitata]
MLKNLLKKKYLITDLCQNNRGLYTILPTDALAYWTVSLEGRLFSSEVTYAIRGQVNTKKCNNMTLYPKLLSFIMCFVRINVSSWILLYIISVTADPSRGSIGFYADSSCREQVNSAQDVATGACVNTKGVIAVAAGSLPSCGHTRAILYISDIAGCMDPSFLPIVSSGHVGDCLSFIEGRLIDSAYFQCKNSTDGMGSTPDNTPDYTTGGPPGDPLPSDDPLDNESGSGGGDLSLGSILGIVFAVISAIASVVGVAIRILVYRRSRRYPRY